MANEEEVSTPLKEEANSHRRRKRTGSIIKKKGSKKNSVKKRGKTFIVGAYTSLSQSKSVVRSVLVVKLLKSFNVDIGINIFLFLFYQ